MERMLVEWLVEQYPTAKRVTLKRMVEEGRVTINGERARRLKEMVREGDVVRVGGRVERAKASIEPLRIIHEDGDVLVVHKPAGLLTSTVEKEWRPTAIGIIRRYLADRQPRAVAGVVHRLDRDAEGLLVFSKNATAYASLKEQFYVHSVERVYLAVVEGRPAHGAGRIESHLVERADGSVHSTRLAGKGQRAITEYEVVAEAGGRSLVRVTLHTGRKHQIRVHLSEQGTPIAGDPVYGKGAKEGQGLMLVAAILAFDHPRTGERMRFEIAPTGEMLRLMGAGE